MDTKEISPSELIFQEAVKRGDLFIVKKAIQFGANVDTMSETGFTALMVAAYQGHLEVVNLLLKGGANIDARFEDGSTALVVAAYQGHLEVVDLLLKKGADVNASDRKGRTAFKWAEMEGHSEVAEMLKKTNCPTIHVGPDIPNSNSSFRKTFPFGNPNTYRFNPPALLKKFQ